MTCKKCAERRRAARDALLNAAMGISRAVDKITKPARKAKKPKEADNG